MLSLEPPYFQVEGITIFRDHAVPTQFYYAAPNPKITRTDGRLMFDLFMYAVALEHSPLAGTSIPAELGAGFLTMGVDCALSDNKRAQILRDLSARTNAAEEQISLFPIAYHKSAARILALDKFSAPSEPLADPGSPERLKNRPTFVEEIIGASTPSLLGDLRTIFSLQLSQQGAVFLEGLYQDRAAPVGIIYELKFYGLRPAVQARITADLERVYTHFGGSASLKYGWFSAEVEGAIKKMEERGEIKIELTSQAVSDEAQKSKDLALSLFRDRIVQEMFRPAPQTPQFDASRMIPNAAAQNAAALTLKARAEISTELKSLTYDFNERSPEERTHAPQGFLPVLLDKNEVAARTHRINLDHEFFQLLSVLVSGPSREEFAELGIREVKIDLSYGAANDGQPVDRGTLLFRPDSTGDKEFAVPRRSRKSLSYTYSLTYEFVKTDFDVDAFRYEIPARSDTRRTLRINPNVDFGVLKVEVEAGRIPPEITEVDVDLKYDSADDKLQANDHFRLKIAAPEKHEWRVRTLNQPDSNYTAAFSYLFADKTVYAVAPQQFREQLLTVDAPFVHERRLLVRPNVISSGITNIDLEIEYADEPNRYRRDFFQTIAPPFAPVEIKWLILNQNAQKIRYRVTAHEPGFITEGEWQTTADPSIIIGSTGSRLATVKVQFVGPTLAEIEVDAVLLRVQPLSGSNPNDAEIQSFLLESGQTAQEVKILVAPGESLRYQYQTRVFKRNGSEIESFWKETATTLLAISTRSLG